MTVDARIGYRNAVDSKSSFPQRYAAVRDKTGTAITTHRPGVLVTIFALLLTSSVSAAADDSAGLEAITALGNLNGIALGCKYINQVRRMKQAVIANAPKERSYGIAFDDSTNDAFVAFIGSGKQCPGEATLASQVDAAVQAVEQAFTKQ